MIEEIDSEEIHDFLAQSGVKGMRWGVRKARSANVKVAKAALNSPSAKLGTKIGTKVKEKREAKTPKTPEQKKLRNQRILGGAMIVAGGALFAKMVLDQHKTMKARDAANIYNASKNIKRAQQVNDIISMNSARRMSTIRTGFTVGPSSTVRSGFKVGSSGVAEATTTTKSVVTEILKRR
jgi:hypothetical protein